MSSMRTKGKKVKKLTALMLCLLCVFNLALALAEPLQIAALKGPTAMGLVKMMKDSEGGADYAFTLAASPDAILPGLVRGSFDIACIPVSLAAVLYHNTEGAIRIIAINTLGALYIVEREDSVQTLSDLAGRTLYASGKASTPEYVLRSLLENAKITNLNLEWKSEHSEALAALMNDPKGLALLPQPFVAVAQEKIPDLRVALDLNALWAALGEGQLITGVTVARQELLSSEAGRRQINRFMDDCAVSVSYDKSNIKEAAALIEVAGILAAGPAEKALPFCGITFIQGEEMKSLLSAFYLMLFEQNPASVGGAVPEEQIYYLR